MIGDDQTGTNDTALELAIVIPTYNERDNISPLLAVLEVALEKIVWEVIFVDDNSPDGTSDHIRSIGMKNRRVRIMERIGRRGLSSACIEGMLATSAPYIAVMDADLQHDESILPRMLHHLKAEGSDIVVGTRRISGGSMGEMSAPRAWLSESGAYLSRKVFQCKSSDPMSGFFLIDRAYFQQVVYRLTGIGFKILLDLFASSPRPVRFGEIPYHFRSRTRGQSKLDLRVEMEFLYLLTDKILGEYIPTRFAIFVLVGTCGLVLHLSILGILYQWLNMDFIVSQAVATLAAMTSNFILNNMVTFRDRRLRRRELFRGLLIFYLACSVGTWINISFSASLVQVRIPWYVAGLTGMAISSVWNYGVNTVLTWRKRPVTS
jgi:dolichol-phosphate mannosyltransferase